MKWQAATHAERYKVEIRDNTDYVAASATTSSLSWTLRGPPHWNRPRGLSRGRSSHGLGRLRLAAYVGRTFTLTGSAGHPALPLTPLTGPAGTRFPALPWERPPARRTTGSRLASRTGFWDEATCAHQDTPLSLPLGDRHRRPVSHHWHVRLAGEGLRKRWHHNFPVGARSGRFEIIDPPAVTGQPLALDGQALDDETYCDAPLGADGPGAICQGVPATPVLDWDSVPEPPVHGLPGQRPGAHQPVRHASTTRTPAGHLRQPCRRRPWPTTRPVSPTTGSSGPARPSAFVVPTRSRRTRRRRTPSRRSHRASSSRPGRELGQRVPAHRGRPGVRRRHRVLVEGL